VNGQARKRGRPRKAFFLNGSFPSRGRTLTALATSLRQGARIFDAQTRKDFRVGPHVPLDLVWPLLSLGEGDPFREAESISIYKAAIARQADEARAASEARAAFTAARVKCVRKNCDDLLRMVEDGLLTRNSAVEVVRRAWPVRGDGRPKPSVRTLNDWLS
jgi:hypothetical protein